MKEYILMPSLGWGAPSADALAKEARDVGARPLSLSPLGANGGAADIDIVDRIGADGPKVARMEAAVARRLRRSDGLKLAPIRKYRAAVMPMRTVSGKGLFEGGGPRASVRFRLVVEGGQEPVEGATVVAVLDRQRRKGVRSRPSGPGGRVTLTVPAAASRAEELLVYPGAGTWGFYGRNVPLEDGRVVALRPIDLGAPDLLQESIGAGEARHGRGVRVGVVDSGIDATHPDLTVFGGRNFAPDGEAGDWGAGANGHGTHVAGIIAGAAAFGRGMRGVAPAAELYSYRVFPKAGGDTSNVAIFKAIKQALEDRCDILNLSLGGDLPDPALNQAIGEAFDNGLVCVVAAGNNGRKPVSYPAWYKRAIAVSAHGREGAFPEGSTEASEVEGPRSETHRDRFIALFSNIGYEIDFTAPGVGIVSCYPGGRYAVMSGTSMACPAVAGAAAALLGADRALLAAPRDRDRARRIAELCRENAEDLGFTRLLQGFGLPVVKKGALS